MPEDAIDDGSSKGGFVVVLQQAAAPYEHWAKTVQTVDSA
jgi:predicted rRNA methylase YqxC with S4 and FtsJ domains